MVQYSLALWYICVKLLLYIMILGDRFTLLLTYYIKMSCLYCRLVSLLLMTNCLPKFYIPLLTVISTFSRVFQISFLQIVLSKDRYWTHQYCLALLSIWTQLCLWVWIHLRKYRNAIILMWDRNILALRKMPFPWVLIDLCKKNDPIGPLGGLELFPEIVRIVF